MAHRIVGLDIGHYTVKALGVLSRVRGYDIEFYVEVPLRAAEAVGETATAEPPGDAGAAATVGRSAPLSGVAGALAELRARGALEADQVVVGYSLFDCLQTEVELPFSRRADILRALPAQIEDRLPVELDRLAIDFHAGPPRGPGGERRVSVVATPRDRLQAFLALLSDVGVDPHVVDLTPANLLAAFRMLHPGLEPATAAVVDIGHEFTDVCVVEGAEIALMRRLRTSGREFTERLAADLRLPADLAEQHKHEAAAVAIDPVAEDTGAATGEPAIGSASAVAAELAGELSRTLHAHTTQSGRPVEAVYLCGGGSLLSGLPRFLAAALQLPVEVLWIEEVEALSAGAGPRAVGALGLVARGLGREPASAYNLRQGDYAFKGNLDFLRKPVRSLALFTVFLIAVLGFALFTERWAAERTRDAHQAALGQLTQNVLGDRIDDPAEVMRKILGSLSSELFPEVTAYQVFRDISQRLVELREDLEITVTVERLAVEMAPRNQINIRGSTDSAESIDEIEVELESLECVGEISRERETRNRTTGLLEFELRAENTCS